MDIGHVKATATIQVSGWLVLFLVTLGLLLVKLLFQRSNNPEADAVRFGT